jgi:hypothetical protein
VIKETSVRAPFCERLAVDGPPEGVHNPPLRIYNAATLLEAVEAEEFLERWDVWVVDHVDRQPEEIVGCVDVVPEPPRDGGRPAIDTHMNERGAAEWLIADQILRAAYDIDDDAGFHQVLVGVVPWRRHTPPAAS